MNFTELINSYIREGTGLLIDYMKENIDISGKEELDVSEMENHLNNLTKCDCCLRHQTNRPCVIGMCEENYIPVEIEPDESQCTCRCRHLARQICKAYTIIDYARNGEYYELLDHGYFNDDGIYINWDDEDNRIFEEENRSSLIVSSTNDYADEDLVEEIEEE